MSYQSICQNVNRKLNLNSLLRRCLIVDPLGDEAPIYDNDNNYSIGITKDENEKFKYVEWKSSRFVNNILNYSFTTRSNQKDSNIENFIYKQFLKTEDDILERLLKRCTDYTGNIINNLNDEAMSKIKGDLIAIDYDDLLSKLLIPTNKINSLNNLKNYYPHPKGTLLGYSGQINVYSSKNIKDIYVLCYPEYTGVMSIRKDVNFINKFGYVEFFSNFGVAVANVRSIFRINEEIIGNF